MKQILIGLFIVVPAFAFGQLGVGYHQSNLPFIGFHYQLKSKLRPEIRLGTDSYFDAMSVEGILTYDLAKKEEYELYTGLGVRLNGFTGLVVPLGLNMYPFSQKQFGFHIEIAPIIGEGSILRGSWGIRYRFKKKDK